MIEEIQLIKPKLVPPLDEDFRPAVLFNRDFREGIEESGEGVYEKPFAVVPCDPTDVPAAMEREKQ